MWIQTGVTVWKRLSWVLTSVTLTFDLWPWPFAWTSLLSLVITPENYMMIRWWEDGEKGVTDGQTDGQTDWTSHIAAWLQLKTIGHLMLLQALCIIAYSLVNSNWSYSPETPNLGKIWRFLEPCDLEIWQMTFKNNRAPLLCYFKLCASFCSHWLIQTEVTVRKRPIWVKFHNFLIFDILGQNGIYFTWVAASYRGEARGLWINASPRERSLVKFHLSEFRIWKGFSPWGNRGSVTCHLLRMKTSATYPQPQVASQHLDGTWTRRPTPLPTAMRVVWWAATGNNTPCRVPGANPGPSAWQACDLPLGHGSCSMWPWNLKDDLEKQ